MPSLHLILMFTFLWPFSLILGKILLRQKARVQDICLECWMSRKPGRVHWAHSHQLFLQLIYICIITQYKGRMWWRIGVYLFVQEKWQLCWGCFRFITVMTLGQFWEQSSRCEPFHHDICSVGHILWSKKFQHCVCRYTCRELHFPTTSRIVRLTPLPPLFGLILFSIEWDKIYTMLLKKKEVLMQLLSSQLWIGKLVRTAVLYFSKIRKCRDEQQQKKNNPGWSKPVPKALFVYNVFASEPASVEINDTSFSLLLMEAASGKIGKLC